MEHRNSTILTGSASLGAQDQMLEMLSTAAHEFFHSWNVERIRPRSLEPFKLDAPNPSGELWFAEGFTSYYERLVMQRSGLWNVSRLASRIGDMLDTVIRSPARKYRSAEEVSRLAQFVDQASWSDPTNLDNTFLSYYTWGAAIGLGLDLSLRTRTDHKVTLDHYMRRLWQDYGRPEATAEGRVARPYTINDLRDVLEEVSTDPEFANDFFDRYIQGRDVVDYQQLLARCRAVVAQERTRSRMDRSSGARLRQRARQRSACRPSKIRRPTPLASIAATNSSPSTEPPCPARDDWRKPFSAGNPGTKFAYQFAVEAPHKTSRSRSKKTRACTSFR